MTSLAEDFIHSNETFTYLGNGHWYLFSSSYHNKYAPFVTTFEIYAV